MIEPRLSSVSVGAATLRTATWGEGSPEIVLLHDGLGSISLWRDLPARLVEKTGATVLAYERPGHGESRPTPSGPWPADWLHAEAERFDGVLDALRLVDPLVVGHSDGGSIALIHAVQRPARSAGLVLLAAHSWVESICTDEIGRMRLAHSEWTSRLARHHSQPAELFEAWSGGWVSEAFATWDIRPALFAIETPTLVVQGQDDIYATRAMAQQTAAAIGGNATCRLLPGLGHALHHDHSPTIVDLVATHHRVSHPNRGTKGTETAR